ncbi:uncharacterized protein METZ01_LOCUS385814, partial [marine metagenome]
YDIEGDELIFEISGGDQIIATLSGNDLTFTPNQDFNGSESFTIIVNDGDLEDSEIFTVTILAVNDAPVLATVSDVSFNEDGLANASLLGSDVDGDQLTFSITEGTDIVAVVDGSNVSFSAPLNFNGSESFTVSVTDGEYTDSQTITVTVITVNDAPIANAAAGTTAEDQSVVINLSGSDIDGDNLTFSLGDDATSGSVSIDGSLATYTPNIDFNGSDSFTFSVSDGEYSASASVDVDVTAVNDAPVLALVSDVSFDEDQGGSTNLSGSDVDGDDLSYNIIGGFEISASLSGAD